MTKKRGKSQKHIDDDTVRPLPQTKAHQVTCLSDKFNVVISLVVGFTGNDWYLLPKGCLDQILHVQKHTIYETIKCSIIIMRQIRRWGVCWNGCRLKPLWTKAKICLFLGSSWVSKLGTQLGPIITPEDFEEALFVRSHLSTTLHDIVQFRGLKIKEEFKDRAAMTILWRKKNKSCRKENAACH